ncbi:hypothetical protein [Methanolapillus ohkumae]|uniref:Uncharacterized protein n=1 Tax=Methanolapillus ohkumae TaxID=3028298 RepID=A0AA96ZXC2_9EURY|nr:hypothetical protein MsAm2_06680 [Methanosarcinaceae archaeon Am2]
MHSIFRILNINPTTTGEKNVEKFSYKINNYIFYGNEKIVSIEKDGTVAYVVLWNDKFISGRVNFAVVTQDDLISSKSLSTNDIYENDIVDIASSISKARDTFWHQSYYDTYGNSITGGVNFHFSPIDAEMLANGVSTIQWYSFCNNSGCSISSNRTSRGSDPISCINCCYSCCFLERPK